MRDASQAASAFTPKSGHQFRILSSASSASSDLIERVQAIFQRTNKYSRKEAVDRTSNTSPSLE